MPSNLRHEPLFPSCLSFHSVLLPSALLPLELPTCSQVNSPVIPCNFLPDSQHLPHTHCICPGSSLLFFNIFPIWGLFTISTFKTSFEFVFQNITAISITRIWTFVPHHMQTVTKRFRPRDLLPIFLHSWWKENVWVSYFQQESGNQHFRAKLFIEGNHWDLLCSPNPTEGSLNHTALIQTQQKAVADPVRGHDLSPGPLQGNLYLNHWIITYLDLEPFEILIKRPLSQKREMHISTNQKILPGTSRQSLAL